MPPDASGSRTQLHGLLASCLGNGIESVLLMSHDGDLLGSATARQQEEQQQGRPSSCEVVGAVASHIWCTYERAGETGVAPQNTAKEGVGCEAPPPTLVVRRIWRSLDRDLICARELGRGLTSGKEMADGAACTGNLGPMLLELTQGHVLITPAGPQHMLGIVAEPAAVELGMLMAKAEGLANYISESLRQIAVAT